MATLIHWLSEGDLTTDGRANEVADLVAANQDRLPDLLAALAHPDPAIRKRARRAVEVLIDPRRPVPKVWARAGPT